MYYQQPPVARSTRGPLLLAALAGFVVAAIIGGVLVAAGAFDGDSGSGVGGSSAAVTMPTAVGTYVRFQDATRNQSSRAKTSVAASGKSDTQTADALAKAHDGAGAAVQTYTDQELLTTFSVWVVRAPTPAPVVPVVDAAYLGLAVAPRYVATFGHSSCLIQSIESTPAGKTPDPDSIVVGLCQRSSGDLTVTYYGGGVGDLSHQPDKIAALVDQVWDAVS